MAAPKKNQFALGNKGGRPPIYETADLLEDKISQYFDDCVKDKESPTITGLTLFLGFSCINSLYDQCQRGDEFSGIIKRARLAVAHSYEKNLDTFKYGGAIFALTNIDKDNWKNAKTTDITSGGEKLTNTIDLSKLSDETLKLIESDILKSNKSGDL